MTDQGTPAPSVQPSLFTKVAVGVLTGLILAGLLKGR